MKHHAIIFNLIDPSVKEDLGVNTKPYFCTSLQIYLTVWDCSHSAYIQFSSTTASLFFLTLTRIPLSCNLFLNLVHLKQKIILFPSKGQKMLTLLKSDISNQKDLTQVLLQSQVRLLSKHKRNLAFVKFLINWGFYRIDEVTVFSLGIFNQLFPEEKGWLDNFGKNWNFCSLWKLFF